MKPKLLIGIAACLVAFAAKAQLNQRFDNTVYKTLYLKDAARLIASNPNLLLLDVRSPEEYVDTFGNTSLNLGRLKGSVNVWIDSIKNHLKELEQYKDREILVYCTHSQRSRMVSKILGDSGFKKVYNMNGGMSLVNKSSEADFPGKSELYVSNHPYVLIQRDEACTYLQDKRNVVIDLRPASEFNGTDSIEENNPGRVKQSINMPAVELDRRLDELAKYKSRPVLLVGKYTRESTDAALKLKRAGFEHISVLYEGISTLITSLPSSSDLRTHLFTGMPRYNIVGSRETIDLVETQPDLLILDLRPEQQFTNKTDKYYLNVGHIRRAVNIHDGSQLNAYLGKVPKTTPILLYGTGMEVSSGNTSETDPAKVCKRLCANGYTHVYMVYNGVYSLAWSVANEENCRDGSDILTDHVGLY